MTLINVKPAIRKRKTNGFFPTEVDRLFNDFFRNDFPTFAKENNFVNRQPALNVVETADAFRLELAVPGLEKSDISLKVEKGILYISGKKAYEQVEGEKVRRQEFGTYAFERNFKLAKSIDNELISATFNNGILSIELPKKEEAKAQPPRTIEVA